MDGAWRYLVRRNSFKFQLEPDSATVLLRLRHSFIIHSHLENLLLWSYLFGSGYGKAFLVSTRRQSILRVFFLCDGLNLGWSPPANLLDLVRKIRLYSDRSGFGLVNTSDAKPISPLVFIGFEFLKINKRKFVNSTVSPWLYTNTVRRYSISRS